MRLVYFRLKGYVNILQGMGLDEIVIPFDKLINRIILIQGANGTGKSTLLTTMVPNPDTSESFRTDVIVDERGVQHIVEYPAEKELHYIDDEGSVYKVLIKSVVNDNRTSRTTKAYIEKDGVEYNPNGNVSSFKEFRDDLFGINPTYLEMSSITSENRGLIDMTPSERRKYLSSFIGSVETFNNIFKSISKVVSLQKADIANLNNRIYNMGDGESLEVDLESNMNEVRELQDKKDSTLKEIASNEAIIKMLDPSGQIQESYNKIVEDLKEVKAKISINDNNIERFAKTHTGGDFKSELDSVNSNIDKVNKELSDASTELKSLSMYIETIQSDIASNNMKLEKLVSEDYDATIVDRLDVLDVDIKLYEDKIGKDVITALSKIGNKDVIDLVNNLTNFKCVILPLKDANMNSYKFAIECISNELSLDEYIISLKDEIMSLELKVSNLKRTQESLEEDQKSIKLLGQRPKACKDDTCIFIKELVDVANRYNNVSIDEEIDRVLNTTVSTLETIKEKNINLEKCNEAIDIFRAITKALSFIDRSSSIIEKFDNLKWMNDRKKLLTRLIDLYTLDDEIKVANSLYAMTEDVNNYNILIDEYIKLKAKYEANLKNKSDIDSITETVSNLMDKLNETNEKTTKITSTIVHYKEILDNFEKRKVDLEYILGLYDIKQSLDNDMDRIRTDYATIKDNIKSIKDKVDRIEELHTDLDGYNNSIEILNNTIAEQNIKISNLRDYKHEVESLKVEYEKMNFIRNLCSQTSGSSIQAEYVKMYMNDIISTCNSLLKYMFDGSLTLQLPVIGEKDFSIPFIGPFGMVVPDISNGSTAQKCMIGLVFNCASMLRMSTKYNLFRLDEIDGGLDTENRYGFITALNYLLDITKAEQCIMVSHNNEFDTQSVSKIICTKNGISFE